MARTPRTPRTPPSRPPPSVTSSSYVEHAIITASPRCSSPPAESSREALSREHAAVPPPPPTELPWTVSPPSGPLRPRRARLRALGELLMFVLLSSVPHSLCAALPPFTANRRRGHGRRLDAGDHLVLFRRPLCSTPSPLAFGQPPRNKFRSEAWNS